MKKILVGLSIVAVASLIAGLSLSAWFVHWEFNSKDDGILQSLDPSFRLGMHLGAGEELFELKQYQLAENEFRKALIISNETGNKVDNAEALTRVGQSLSRQGRSEESIAVLKHAAAAYDECSDDMYFTVEKRVRVQCLTELGRLLEKSGKPKEAAQARAQAEDISKDFSQLEKFRESVKEM